jgi:hypothetical protein
MNFTRASEEDVLRLQSLDNTPSDRSSSSDYEESKGEVVS